MVEFAPMWGTTARPALLLAGVLLVVGCGPGRAPEPARPDRALVPDVIDVAQRWEFGPCDQMLVELRSDRVVEIVRDRDAAPGCPDEDPTPFLLGDAADLTTGSDAEGRWGVDRAYPYPHGPLVFLGSDGGAPWVAAIAAPMGGCWEHWLGEEEGVWMEGDTLHFSSGLVLPRADDFRLAQSIEDAFPLRVNDRICVNADGEVTSGIVFSPI